MAKKEKSKKPRIKKLGEGLSPAAKDVYNVVTNALMEAYPDTDLVDFADVESGLKAALEVIQTKKQLDETLYTH